MIAQNAIGCSLKSRDYQQVIEEKPDVDWFEVHSENYFHDGGGHLYSLLKIREEYPLSLHGVGLSLGSAGDLSQIHLSKLKALVDQVDPWIVSEHISWSEFEGVHFNDLLPLPYTKESLQILCAHISQTQDYLGREILVENPSAYVNFTDNDFSETEFINKLTEITGCGLLFDVNNIYVSGKNSGFSPEAYISEIKPGVPQQIHLAGHSPVEKKGHSYLVDTHSDYVCEDVWTLYEKAIQTHGDIPSLVEWDADLPTLKALVAEAQKCRAYMSSAKDLRKAG